MTLRNRDWNGDRSIGWEKEGIEDTPRDQPSRTRCQSREREQPKKDLGCLCRARGSRDDRGTNVAVTYKKLAQGWGCEEKQIDASLIR